MKLEIPDLLVSHCRNAPERMAWLERLPETIRMVRRRWRLTLSAPFEGAEGSCSWVAPATLEDGMSAVLKIGMPHMESEHEIAGLRFWDGDPTVRLIEADEDLGAMLLERGEPGTLLRALPEHEQDEVIARLMRRLWRRPANPNPFRSLSEMTSKWRDETLADAGKWPDPAIVRKGLSLFDDLSQSAPEEALLATDLHAGNVVRAQRERWLVIDPKPFLGDTAYDATQHLFNCVERLQSDPHGLIRRMTTLLSVDAERLRLWTFARAAAEPRDEWTVDPRTALARMLAP